jgi:hypothetical protein
VRALQARYDRDIVLLVALVACGAFMTFLAFIIIILRQQRLIASMA